ncbi:hypothetical protein C8F04DRAFT_1126344 [Mycena alexandri]|uniref:Uncharacterized protein n=1 Tax=Mycena alexandri TaxID=1745969 RepID=A0AAD6WUY5_9AGAR|nr:hypothetical protein C8F04DRAFT_1126344 [Mycena alexandri]
MTRWCLGSHASACSRIKGPFLPFRTNQHYSTEMSFLSNDVLPDGDYREIKQRIDNYIWEIEFAERDQDLRNDSVEKFAKYLERFHHCEPGLRNWIYSTMNSAVAIKANEDLTELWTAYKKKSMAAKRGRTQRPNPAPPIDFNTPRTSEGYTAPWGGNYDASSLMRGRAAPPASAQSPLSLLRGRAAQPASTQPLHSSPSSANSRNSNEVFSFHGSSGHNSAAGSYHSQPNRLLYPAMQMPPPPPPPQQPQTQYYAVDPFPRGPVDSQGQGQYFAGPGLPYPPHSGPWRGHGAQQGQGGPYHQ